MTGWLSGSPTLGVVTAPSVPPGLVPVLGCARRWCRIVQITGDWRPNGPEPMHALVTRRLDLAVPGTHRLAVWVDTVDDLDQPVVEGATVVLSSLEAVVEAAGSRGLLVPAAPQAPPGPGPVPVPPFVRARLRAARGLPSRLVIDHDGGWTLAAGQPALPPNLGATAVACASAAVASGPALLEALAWATPCVTDADTARSIGAAAGRHVLVGATPPERRQLALEIAEDERLAARLSWAGRALVEAQHSPAMVAATLVRRLGLAAASPLPGPAPLVAQLAELGTPEGAVIADRARIATHGLPVRKD